MNHVGLKDTAEEMYSALSVTHDNMVHQTVNYIQNQLYETKSHDGEDLLKHLNILKSYCDHINWFLNMDFHVLDTRFKLIILASLPVSWQTFIEPYNGNVNDPNDLDPKWWMSADAFIGLLHKEYKIHISRMNIGKNIGTNRSVTLVSTQRAPGTSKSLEDHITGCKSSIGPYCKHCKQPGHWLSKC